MGEGRIMVKCQINSVLFSWQKPSVILMWQYLKEIKECGRDKTESGGNIRK